MDGAPSCIWVVSPPGLTNARCFEEVALALRDAFAELGVDAPIVGDPRQVRGRALVIGANLLGEIRSAPADGLIIYNLEQVSAKSHWFDPIYLDVLKRFPVWDYSARNIELLKQWDIHAALCGVGYAPALTRIQPASVRDLDIVFIGSFNERRNAILQTLHAAGKKVFAAGDLWGAERDAYYARAKIVLNLHYDFGEAKIFEIVRCSYLLANRVCVVSETGDDESLEAPLRGGVAFASYDKIAETCLRLLDDDAARERMAARGFEKMAALSQTRMVKRALAATAATRPAG